MNVLRELCIWILFAVTMLDHRRVEACQANEFLLPGPICCSFCPDGRYVSKNCSKDGEMFTGVSCENCTKCPHDMRTIANCSQFSNTMCEKKETTRAYSPVTSFTKKTVPPKHSSEIVITCMALCVTIPVLLILIIIAVRWRMRLNLLQDPAEKLFKMHWEERCVPLKPPEAP